ncbi:MAG: FMN-binding protein [Flavobacterium sp.]|nr:MAG: FMN-binding protein [Flavobacterium sp.]
MKNILIVFFIGITTSSFVIPDRIAKKADKVIAKFYEIEDFSKETISISEENNNSTDSEFGDGNLFKINSKTELLGYGYIGSAASKTADYNYLVLFDKDFIITKSKVLIYREEYGGEIGSKRWLKQFIGKSSTSEELIYGETIVPISGATISVRSMTKAINNLLISIGELQKLKAL